MVSIKRGGFGAALVVAVGVAWLAPAAAGAVGLDDGAYPALPQWTRALPGDLTAALQGLLARVWGAEGASADPDGAPATGDEGGSFDPDGAAATGDEGVTADPDGATAPGDEGASADPNG